MPSLVDQFCPNVHDAPITAAAFDPSSGAMATADATGKVAVQRPGEASPQLMFHPGEEVRGALTLIRGGSIIVVGDEQGTIGAYRTDNGECFFRDDREGARGRVRGMRGVAISPEGALVACIARDGILRVWDITRNERKAWQGFSGDTVEFDLRGERLLTMDNEGQPRLMDLMSLQSLYMDRLQTPAERARFTLDGTMVVAVGPAGISLLRVADGAMVSSFATQGGSGIMNLVLAPDGTRVGAVTQRSVHVFSLPDLLPVESRRHGAPRPTGAAIWMGEQILVAGDDGLMHSGGTGSAGPVQAVGGFGGVRLAAHDSKVAVWMGGERIRELQAGSTLREVHVDRDGQLVLAVPQRGPLEVFSIDHGRQVFDGGPSTSGAQEVCLGGGVVAALLARGGVRWWDLSANRGFELAWPTALALSGGGTWLGVVTPAGAVRVLDPATGRDAMPPPVPLADCPVKRLAFVNRRPDLLILDEEGVLGYYDLEASARGGAPAQGRDVLSITVEVDRLWGITGGQYCALRLPEGDSCCILWVDVQACEVVAEVPDLHRHAWVDADNGLILEPVRAAALLEREMNGQERQVYRALPDGQWLSFGNRGIVRASPGAANAI